MPTRPSKHTQPNGAALLRLCLSHDSQERWAEIQQAARQDINWPELANLARYQGVSSLVASQVSALCTEGAAPETAANAFHADAIQVTARALRFQALLEAVLRDAAASGIQLIVLKGLALANLLYEQPYLRPAVDIDILCREEDYRRLFELLVERGYATDGGPELPGQCSSLETAFEQHFIAPGSDIHIELHVDSIKLGVKPVSAKSVWDRAVPVRIGETDALSLSPRDLAVMLPVHLHRHGFNRLIWFKDIDLLLRRYGSEIDWDEVVEDTRSEGASSSLWLTFRFLEKMLGTPLPDGVLRKLQPAPLTRLAWRSIWPEDSVISLEAATRRRAVQFSIEESWRGVIPSLFLMGRRREKLHILFNRLTRRSRKSPSPGGQHSSH